MLYLQVPSSFDKLRRIVYEEHGEIPCFDDDGTKVWVLDSPSVAFGGFAMIYKNQPHLKREGCFFNEFYHYRGLPEISQFFIRKDLRGTGYVHPLLGYGFYYFPYEAVGLIRPSLSKFCNRFFKMRITTRIGPEIFIANHKRFYYHFDLTLLNNKVV